MENMQEDIVIVGAGIAGLATSLGLHRLGLRSLVLESSDGLRITGFALGTWPNAWKALDALGIADSIRKQHLLLRRLLVTSAVSGLPTADVSFQTKGKSENFEIRCIKRKVLLETLESELPHGTIRYSSKVVYIEDSGCFKVVHLADGCVLKTKVLIGCDGVNSVVARWLGLPKPVSAGRSAVRAFAEFPDGHGFQPTFLQYAGKGVRHGFVPSDEKTIHWFFAFSSSVLDNQIEVDNLSKLREFILSKLGKVSEQVQEVAEKTKPENMSCSALKLRLPWQLLWGNISKDNVCVAGDAFHPMTPDLGQGGCAALEDAVVLARCLGKAFLLDPSQVTKGEDAVVEECIKIKKSLEKYANERRWRSIKLIAIAYAVGLMQQSDGKVMRFLRDKVMSRFMAGTLTKMAHYDCGQLDH